MPVTVRLARGGRESGTCTHGASHRPHGMPDPVPATGSPYGSHNGAADGSCGSRGPHTSKLTVAVPLVATRLALACVVYSLRGYSLDTDVTLAYLGIRLPPLTSE